MWKILRECFGEVCWDQNRQWTTTGISSYGPPYWPSKTYVPHPFAPYNIFDLWVLARHLDWVRYVSVAGFIGIGCKYHDWWHSPPVSYNSFGNHYRLKDGQIHVACKKVYRERIWRTAHTSSLWSDCFSRSKTISSIGIVYTLIRKVQTNG